MGTPIRPPPLRSHSSPWLPVDLAPVASSHPSQTDVVGGAAHQHSSHYGNPYVQVSPTAGSYANESVDTICKALGRLGKRMETSTLKAMDVAGGVWNHLKTSHNLTDTAMSRLYQETKAYAEGGHDKIFKQNFGMFPGEELLNSYACYLSTTSGPLAGTLYLSTVRLAFCSDKPVYDNPLHGYYNCKYYKVVVRLDQLRTVNPSYKFLNPSEKYIQIVTQDGRDFWFMGFISYHKALKHMKEVSQMWTSL